MRYWGSVSAVASASVVQLFGDPDSRNPSTEGRQQLELLYAFERAGRAASDGRLCAAEKDVKPGRAVEITLVAPGL
jgi:hypothetical protein